ncbi:DNA-3-methyladenine glycosylase 2 [Tripterygium wilfordii]|uniref:DNA-3-methyladenine glycosylase 2 n=1 Tax=Tripterygium wilfordii TaxID=458696 RepID=A0A7J7E3F5_TRIWF|nr:DNA-3-methyladenine glycosylase 1 [Tripterygium wilfordii]KAF5752984.1 DNA-3-methyladenine glycosylase 2 [Tripterygium wilfordii]
MRINSLIEGRLCSACSRFSHSMAKRTRINPPPRSPPVAADTTFASHNAPSSSTISFRSRKIRKVINPAITSKEPPVNASSESSPQPLAITKPSSLEPEINQALQHLRNSDPLLAALIDKYNPPTFDSQSPPFQSLVKSILYQQLATKAAKSIYDRFITLCGGDSGVSPETLLALSAQQLRQVGVSGRKASYLHDLSEKYTKGDLSDASILAMDDDMLLARLIMVKGIGVWSVHMFMIFSLHRPDVLPVGDLGVRKGVQVLYGLKELPKPLQMEQACEKWRPYRSIGSWYMWRLMEAKALTGPAKKKK